MLVIAISECRGAALKRSRMVLDRCLERIGERTWRGRLTQEGLRALREGLSERASKNTSVAAHLVRGTKRFELLWIVGSAARFDEHGAVSTYEGEAYSKYKQTSVALPHAAPWISAVCELAGLWHDVGKGTIQFQSKLARAARESDSVRHEILSSKLFLKVVDLIKNPAHCSTTEVAAACNAALSESIIVERTNEAFNATPTALPTGLRYASWLIATHHRMLAGTPVGGQRIDENGLFKLKEHTNNFSKFPAEYRILQGQFSDEFFSRTAALIRTAVGEQPSSPPDWRIVLGYGRMSLILADRIVSTEKPKDIPPAPGALLANTHNGKPNQSLRYHLFSVADACAMSVSDLLHGSGSMPELDPAGLPREIRGISAGRFAWQDYGRELIAQRKDGNAGFFGVVVGRTGSGKTRGCAKLMAAFGDRVRYTFALPLRSLTLQAGSEYRDALGLSSKEVTTIIGSDAVRNLFDLRKGSDNGSGWDFKLADGLAVDGEEEEVPLYAIPYAIRRHIAGDPKARRILGSPILVATVDQLMDCADMRRTSFLVAALRLLTSDLILDEVDSFDEEDLVAVGRLIHMAGVFGRRVMISSATIPPAVVYGLLSAYRAGWRSHAHFFGKNSAIDFAFFSDSPTASRLDRIEDVATAAAMTRDAYAVVIADNTSAKPVRRMKVLDLDDDPASAYSSIFADLEANHSRHHTLDKRTGKRVSFQLVRFARIRDCVGFARDILGIESSISIKLIVYHSAFPVLIRDRIERFLDSVLVRKETKLRLPPTLRRWISSVSGTDAMLIVVASPVEEIGRDHDFDAAIIEPSSSNAIIQCAGRVNRHRLIETAGPNVTLLSTSMLHLRKPNGLSFSRPGVEALNTAIGKSFRLPSPDIKDLLIIPKWEILSASPRLEEAGWGEMPSMEHQKAAHFLEGNYDYSLVGYWSDATNMYLSGDHAEKIRFRADDVYTEFYYDYRRGRFLVWSDDSPTTQFVFREDESKRLDRFSRLGIVDLGFDRNLEEAFDLKNKDALYKTRISKKYLSISLVGEKIDHICDPYLGAFKRQWFETN